MLRREAGEALLDAQRETALCERSRYPAQASFGPVSGKRQLMAATKVFAAIAYLALMTAWIYGIFERDAYYDAWWIPLVLALHLVVGYVIGRWWAIALAAMVPVLAVPAGDAEHGDTPTYVPMLWFAGAYGALLAVGVLLARRRTSS
jgi:hypothetical protein